MADRRRHQALAQLVAIRSAERAGAQIDLAVATVAEDAAEKRREACDARSEAAVRSWTQLIRDHFDPTLAQSFAAHLSACAAASDKARADVDDAAATRAEAGQALVASDARMGQADGLFRDSARRLARAREERTLELQADRVSMEWTRR